MNDNFIINLLLKYNNNIDIYINDFYINIIENLFKYTLFWSSLVYILRKIFVDNRHYAASLVSLTFCAWTVLYATSILYLALPWPNTLFNFELYEYHQISIDATKILPARGPIFELISQRIVSIQSIDDYLYFAFTYLITDMIYDYDIRFVVHHILTATAVFTTWSVCHLHGSFLMTAWIAEIGGVTFHVSKLVRKQWMEFFFLITYTISRIILFPLLIIWLIYSIWYYPSNNIFHLLIDCWATGGTTILVGININWCRKQWIRYRRKYNRNGPLAFSVKYEPKENRKYSSTYKHQRVFEYAPETVVDGAPPPRFSKTTRDFIQDGIGFAWDILS